MLHVQDVCEALTEPLGTSQLNGSSSKSREAAEARRKAEGKSKICESNNWLFFDTLPLHAVKYKRQQSEVAIEARLLAHSES